MYSLKVLTLEWWNRMVARGQVHRACYRHRQGDSSFSTTEPSLSVLPRPPLLARLRLPLRAIWHTFIPSH